ncbi:MAG: DUF2207 domain-containing protein, partial [Novosphingobium sp.]|nr:DUF2207 domain-containing protein [Novosphingobium sp.]
LGSNEGLTVSVAWPKGVIARPGPRTQAWLRLTDRAGYITGGFGLLILLAFYLTAWLRVGRDPPAGTIVPLFTPPDGLSAAAMRYIVRMGMDDRTFAAALVDLGVRGRLRLVEGKKPLFGRAPMTIERNAAGAPASDASTTEDRMLDRLLLGSGRTITMTQENYKAFQRARTELETGFRTAYEDRLFVTNRRWALHGMALFSVVLCVTLSVILRSVPGSALFFYVALIVALFLAVGFIPRWFAAPLAARLQAIGDSIVLVGGGLLAFLLLPMAIGNALDEAWALAIPLLALPVAVTAFRWVEAPTRQGREVLDRIAGFRQYLSIAEEDRLARLNPPEKTPELFERYLPYAIALHVENAWADRFTGVLAAAQQAGTAMAWYSGHNSPWTQTGAFVGSVGSALSSSVASASSSPSSSGGGSSGGGGGGGGGGGW